MIISCKYLAVPYNFDEMFIIGNSILNSLVNDKYKTKYDSMGRYDYNTFYLSLLYLLMKIDKYINLKEYLLTTILLPINTINSKYDFKLNEIFDTEALKIMYSTTKISEILNATNFQRNPSRVNLNLKNKPKSITLALESSTFDKTMLSYSNDGMQNPYMGFDYQVNNLHQLSMDGLYEDDDEVNEKINTALIEEKTGTTGVEKEIRDIFIRIEQLSSDIKDNINVMETNENFDHSMIYGMKMKNNKILMESIAKNENHIHRLNILHYEMHDANIYSKLTKNQNTDLLMLKHAIEFYIIKKNIQIESIQTFVFFLVYYRQIDKHNIRNFKFII